MQKNGSEKDIRKLLEELFLREKPAKILIALKNAQHSYTTSVAKAVDCTYSHTTKVLDQLKDLKLVDFDKQGRVKNVKLTPEGEDLAHDLEGIVRKFNRLRDKLERGEDAIEESEVEPKEAEDNNSL